MKKYIAFIFFTFASAVAIAQHQHFNLLIGSYTNTGKSEGIYVYDFDTKTASTQLKTITKNIVNPNYLSLSPDQKYVYVANEIEKTGSVSAFGFNAENGTLTLLNTVSSEGLGPCHVTADDQNVLVANYRGGSLAVFNRLADGSLSSAVQMIKHTGKSVHPGSQTSAHVHQNQFTPDHQYVLCNDLGEDLTYVYRYHPTGKAQTLTFNSVAKASPGSGPRHLTFSPNGKFAYLVNELNGKVTAFSYTNGILLQLQEISTTPPDFTGKIAGADIHISADGKFLYETNRGDLNSISTFSVLASGQLKLVETVSALGNGPRNFTIAPDGNFLLVAHQYSNEVVIFHRHKKTGKLTDSGKRIAVGAPSCLVFAL